MGTTTQSSTTQKLNLFLTVLTETAPSSANMGEGESNRANLQTLPINGIPHAIVSSVAVKNRWRECLGEGIPVNRSRVNDAEQLQVRFNAFPNAELYADDFLFGYFIADSKVAQKAGVPAKRRAVLQTNLAVALHPYGHDALMIQAPQSSDDSPWKNSKNSGLLSREVSVTAFQFPIAIAGTEAAAKPDWVRAALLALTDLNGVAGGNTNFNRSFEPRSLVARITTRRAPGYNTYAFDRSGQLPEIITRILSGDDLPGAEFILGGAIARALEPATREALVQAGVTIIANPDQAMAVIAEQFGLGSDPAAEG